MGPAYLIDVVGIDTGVHGAEVMAEGFPDRMKPDFKGSIEIMYENKRLGQKNDVGFYKYELDRKGKKPKWLIQLRMSLLLLWQLQKNASLMLKKSLTV
jgi:3-hydroxyacyl-CoA dehydrogenase/enoyl-CoA hydratase/3-hydroxybutyryl-CoA epimerase/enoyl-CoA isomerase